MSKYVLKVWLTDNPLTTRSETEKYFSLDPVRKVDSEMILERMMAKNPGVRKETMALSVKLMEEVIMEALMSGEIVNTGLFHAVAKLRGKVAMNNWDPDTNSIRVSITQGKQLREAIKNTRVEVKGERPANFRIINGQNAATRSTGFNATAGRNFILTGKNLTVAGDDPSVGITLKSIAKGTVTKIEANRIVMNGPSRLIILLPESLKDGEYILTITSQYKRSGKNFLKTPRSISCHLYVGIPPSGGNGGSEQGIGSGGNGGQGGGGNPLG